MQDARPPRGIPHDAARVHPDRPSPYLEMRNVRAPPPGVGLQRVPPDVSGSLAYDPYRPAIPLSGSIYQGGHGLDVPNSQSVMERQHIPMQMVPMQGLAQSQLQPHLQTSVPQSELPGRYNEATPLGYGMPPVIPQPIPTYVPTPSSASSGFLGNLPVDPMQPSVLPMVEEAAPANTLKSQVDINDLLSKLMSSGILTKPQSPAAPEQSGTPPPAPAAPVVEKEDKPQEKKPTNRNRKKKAKKEEGETVEKSKVNLLEELNLYRGAEGSSPFALGHSDIKQRYPGVIYSIISGTQCSSCGMRFSIELMEEYRKHLDWHFRQNRKDKDGIKSATSRKWYYELDEWLLYEEIDASEEGYRSAFFEQQAEEATVESEQEGRGVPVTGVEEDEFNWLYKSMTLPWNHEFCIWRIFRQFPRDPGMTDGTLPGLDSDNEVDSQDGGTELEDNKPTVEEILNPTSKVTDEMKSDASKVIKEEPPLSEMMEEPTVDIKKESIITEIKQESTSEEMSSQPSVVKGTASNLVEGVISGLQEGAPSGMAESATSDVAEDTTATKRKEEGVKAGLVEGVLTGLTEGAIPGLVDSATLKPWRV
ncbi:putative serine/arginine repetitive matrix protein 2 [Apostichopus japonicus]|uniref:Putative serine/arginine repetitive matrix protein 2 n=1 Tax=Stichopus japonicus TaxID=307972 RepID=A0A2G8JQK0_STIJA|nr:putative serine/arginine repetitive matrix protein 2 [Apostichopus japonicus]